LVKDIPRNIIREAGKLENKKKNQTLKKVIEEISQGTLHNCTILRPGLQSRRS